MRRFNWFDYPHEDRLQNLVFNPNVTVRSRGVMEKCTFCVQRIEENKIEAKRLGQPLADGAIKTACEQVCPAQAIVFGDLQRSEQPGGARWRPSRRAYRVLEELNTQPAVRYLKLVRHDRPAAAGRRGATDWLTPSPSRRVPLIGGNKSAADVTRDVVGALDARPSRAVVGRSGALGVGAAARAWPPSAIRWPPASAPGG